MAGLRSGSGHSGGSYESYTRGPAGGQTTMRGRGRGGGGFDAQSMAEAMLAEAQSSARSRRSMAEDRHSEYMRGQRKKRAPKLGGGKLKKSAVDPMRYANTQRQAARNAQFAKGGTGSYGQGELAMAHEGDQAYQAAMGAYPAYLAMMQG